jgi:hypothetical protein
MIKDFESIRQHGQRDNNWCYNRILRRSIGDSVGVRQFPVLWLPQIEEPMNEW